jgi:SPP1 gp7 family putative phage head morphogenesis protein
MQAAYSLAVEAAIRAWFAEHRGLVQDAAPRRRAAELVDQAVRSIESSVNEEMQPVERIQGARAAGGAQLLEAFRSRNVSLIVTVGEETKTRLDGALKKWGNLHVNDLTAKLLEVSDVSRARARFWARDQTLKLAASVTRAKHESLGIVEYVWRTSGDGTVRPSHDALDGKTFRYDDPPETGTGVHNPGEDYQCRCHADPVLETAIDPRDIARAPEPARARAAAPRARKPKPRAPVAPAPSRAQPVAPPVPARPLVPGAPRAPAFAKGQAPAPAAPVVLFAPAPSVPAPPVIPPLGLLDRIKLEAAILRAPVLRHAALLFSRGGMRSESRDYARAQLAGASDVTAAALARDPIVVAVYHDGRRELLDGRHRLEAATLAGARAIRVTVRTYGPRGALRSEATTIWQLDRSSAVIPPWQ